MAADEVVQVYIQYPAAQRMPLKELKAFKRIALLKSGHRQVEFKIPVKELQKWDLATNKWLVYPGTYKILVGASSEDIRLTGSLDYNSPKRKDRRG